VTESHGSTGKVQRLDGLALKRIGLAIIRQAVADDCDLTLTLKVSHNGLGTPAVMRAECQIIDLKETQTRTLADGAKDSTLRELLTQRRDGAGKHGGGFELKEV